MKLWTTRKQWDQLKEEHQWILLESGKLYETPPGIDQLIWFVGSHLRKMARKDKIGTKEWLHWQVMIQVGDDRKYFAKEELVDALWEAVKYIIKKC